MALLRWKPASPKTTAQNAEFGTLVSPFLPSLFNVAVWLSRNTTDAEDLVQETTLKALRGFASFQPGTNFKAWIFRILRNTYLTSRSGLAVMRTVYLEDELVVDKASGASQYPEEMIDRNTPEAHVIQMATRAELEAAMEQLPPPLLEVILLCDVEEMKYREIAVILDVPIGTIMSRIARGRAAIRQILEAKQISTRGFRA